MRKYAIYIYIDACIYIYVNIFTDLNIRMHKQQTYMNIYICMCIKMYASTRLCACI